MLSDANTTDIAKFYGDYREAVLGFAERAKIFELEGVVVSTREVPTIRAKFGDKLTTNVTAVRPSWSTVPDDDQNQMFVRTPTEAVRAGATRIIVGRPITLHPDPREATEKILEEMESALETMSV